MRLTYLASLLAITLFFMPNLYANEPLSSYFQCKEFTPTGRFKPYYMQAVDNGTRYIDYSTLAKGLLGQNYMRSLSECTQAVEAANSEFGVICSRTGLDGWKPTIYTGGLPGRSDFGYLGGSSIMEFSDCLTSTARSSARGVCFWGGSDWYVSPIDRAGVSSGPYRTLATCTAETMDE
jgi:hypothetical protein